MNTPESLNNDQCIKLPCIKVSQPVGDFYIASMDSSILKEITFADIRKINGDRDVDSYLGIQREINKKRVKEIGEYVNTFDACFPTAVILAVDGKYAEYDQTMNQLILRVATESNGPDSDKKQIKFQEIAKVLDGQHRIEGLQNLNPNHDPFEVNVSIFIDMDIESQAYLFSIVNLAQTKVNKSLVYDLFEYSRARSPQKTAHNIAVALDRDSTSPFFERIKRLGVATRGRFTETLTQATFVESLLEYLSSDPINDRDIFLRGMTPPLAESDELRRYVFRNMFLQNRDLEIADIIYSYFLAIKKRWPTAWAQKGDGAMLNKTNGFKAFMRLLRPIYLYITSPGEMVSLNQFLELLNRSSLLDDEFNIENFKPGTSGETSLFNRLIGELNLKN